MQPRTALCPAAHPSGADVEPRRYTPQHEGGKRHLTREKYPETSSGSKPATSPHPRPARPLRHPTAVRRRRSRRNPRARPPRAEPRRGSFPSQPPSTGPSRGRVGLPRPAPDTDLPAARSVRGPPPGRRVPGPGTGRGGGRGRPAPPPAPLRRPPLSASALLGAGACAAGAARASTGPPGPAAPAGGSAAGRAARSGLCSSRPGEPQGGTARRALRNAAAFAESLLRMRGS